ncbi:ABC transporter ATP-binding protein [Pararhizobium sp. IMCC21322]|uniref:ABC transporter ATP-binding protein n=1 Tax=Pararhizobium sp. IMCC21322 TaxID=3067903 RepID=UPI0027425C97|nr:ABC transporter ATP-binding protein [Pararhizobium sp. IMCC21322]
MSTVLKLQDVSKAFGAITVSDELSYELQSGEALGVIGPNGAGKTSMFNLITGALTPDAGSIWFNGTNVTGMSAAKRCRSGIARSFQIPQPFGAMSVFENALVAATHGAGLAKSEANEQCLSALEQTGLLPKANILAGNLTLLERKRLELTRALCARPKLLLLDEIAGGLTEKECHSLVETIKDIRSTGISIIWIEHIVHALLAVVDRLVVIDFGRKIAEGEPKAIMDSKQVKEIYMGIEVDG